LNIHTAQAQQLTGPKAKESTAAPSAWNFLDNSLVVVFALLLEAVLASAAAALMAATAHQSQFQHPRPHFNQNLAQSRFRCPKPTQEKK
jgi:hypothetical protein